MFVWMLYMPKDKLEEEKIKKEENFHAPLKELWIINCWASILSIEKHLYK